jgi:anhydro-N-acetylmuramic acid kinase
LSVRIGQEFAHAANAALESVGLNASDVTAIGSHGQTLWHAPQGKWRNTLQIGDASTISALTGITTVADFRTKDVALGGQGAPLVPPFHAALFRTTDEPRVVLNIGGIANITVLPSDAKGEVRALDTGPGNTLLDGWIRRVRGLSYDQDGAFARSGQVSESLLARLLTEPYFSREIPKSTGRETFNLGWLESHLKTQKAGLLPEDVQRTLLELTTESVARHIRQMAPDCGRIFVCGGGSKNGFLMERLSARLSPALVASTDSVGVPANSVEGMAFAWLAARRLALEPGNLPGVTGASRPAVLGGVYAP